MKNTWYSWSPPRSGEVCWPMLTLAAETEIIITLGFIGIKRGRTESGKDVIFWEAVLDDYDGYINGDDGDCADVLMINMMITTVLTVKWTCKVRWVGLRLNARYLTKAYLPVVGFPDSFYFPNGNWQYFLIGNSIKGCSMIPIVRFLNTRSYAALRAVANCPAAFLSYFHCGFVMKYSRRW